MAYFPASCDYKCKECSQNKCWWCAFLDRPATYELASTTNQSATVINYTKEE